MKNQNRIRKNAATKTAASQAKIHNEFALPREAGHASCLCVYDRHTQKPVSKIPLSDDEFCKLVIERHLLCSKFRGVAVEDLVAQAIRENLTLVEPQSAKPAAPIDGHTTVSLFLMDNQEGMSIADVDVTREQFETIRRNAAAGNSSLEQILTDGLNRMVRNIPTGELEVAKNQSIALAQLLLDSESHHLGGGDLPDAGRNRMNAGGAELVRQTNARLDAAFNSVVHAIHSKGEEAAS